MTALESTEVDSEEVERRVAELRARIAPDLYQADAFLRRPHVDAELSRIAPGIAALQRAVDLGRPLDGVGVADSLAESECTAEVLRIVLTAAQDTGFADGRVLDEPSPEDEAGRMTLGNLAHDLGIAWMLPPGARVVDVVRTSLVAADAGSRARRRSADAAARAEVLIDHAVAQLRERLEADVRRVPKHDQPHSLRNRVDALISVDGAPVAAVATVLQTQSGGRQQRDLTQTYPQLQRDLDELPAHLIVILDGPGVAKAGPRVLRTLVHGVATCMSFAEVEEGDLVRALGDAVRSRGARAVGDDSLEALIESRLRRGLKVDATALPLPSASAALSFARFAQERPELALEFDEKGLRWSDASSVERAQWLIDNPSPSASVSLLTDLLGLSGLRPVDPDEFPGGTMTVGDGPLDQVLPSEIVVGAAVAHVDAALVRAFNRASQRASARASVALLVAPGAERWATSIEATVLRGKLATSVVVLSPEALVSVAGARSARDAVVRGVLAQADLTKANPFNIAGPTPPEMFYGREAEESQLKGLLRTNSAALIGGRRVGKTSLIKRMLGTLDDGGWHVRHADLQDASDWHTFVAHVSADWGVELPEPFEPALVGDMIRQLDDGTARPLVIALDEIDDLLRWDLRPREGLVAEAFFRACRAASQEGLAQFVFSGERLLATRSGDASSPHWNFCLPVQVRQLARTDANRLISQPLAALGVRLEDPNRFAQECWDRTQGHPQVVQSLGNQLVDLLNARPPEHRSTLTPEDVVAVADTNGFRLRYLDTYRGQSSELEKLLTALIAGGMVDVGALRDRLRRDDLPSDGRQIVEALEMLELYGIIDLVDDGVRLRATWIGEAMRAIGGLNAVVADQSAALRGLASVGADVSSAPAADLDAVKRDQ